VKNIVLITVDCLRFDHYEKVKTPILNYIKKNHFTTAPFTPNSFKGLFFGELPLSGGTGMTPLFPKNCISNRLRKQGFSTIGLFSNPLLAQLLEGTEWDFLKDVPPIKVKKTKKNYLAKIIRKLRYSTKRKESLLKSSAYADASQITELAIEQIKSLTSDRPTFLWIHYMDSHFPYNLIDFNKKKLYEDKIRRLYERFYNKDVSEDDITLLKSIYSSALSYLQFNIQKLIKHSVDELVDPIIIITSDHGEGFLEHGTISHKPYLFDDLLHVPLLSNIKLFDTMNLTSHIDLFKKILELSGWTDSILPKETENFLTKIKGDFENATFAGVFSDPNNDSGHPRLSLRTNSRKYILYEDFIGYYDLQKDLEENYPITSVSNEPAIDILLERRDVILKTKNINKNYESKKN